MCGIAGIVDFDRHPGTHLVQRMNGSQLHRGPDGDGVFEDGPCTLGHRRLNKFVYVGHDGSWRSPGGSKLICELLSVLLHLLQSLHESARDFFWSTQDAVSSTGNICIQLVKLFF